MDVEIEIDKAIIHMRIASDSSAIKLWSEDDFALSRVLLTYFYTRSYELSERTEGYAKIEFISVK